MSFSSEKEQALQCRAATIELAGNRKPFGRLADRNLSLSVMAQSVNLRKAKKVPRHPELRNENRDPIFMAHHGKVG